MQIEADLVGVIRRRIDNTMINVASGKQQGSQMVMNSRIILQHKYKQYFESSANLNKATVLLWHG